MTRRQAWLVLMGMPVSQTVSSGTALNWRIDAVTFRYSLVNISAIEVVSPDGKETKRFTPQEIWAALA